MVWVSHINLSIDNSQEEGKQEVEISYLLWFSRAEFDLNLRFKTWGSLLERDGPLDKLWVRDVTHNSWHPKLYSDEKINSSDGDVPLGIIFEEIVRPDNKIVILQKHAKLVDIGSFRYGRESGNEEYYAIVRAVPEITWGAGISNEVIGNFT